MPSPYAQGIGKEGVAALKAFVEAGGTLICLDEAGRFAIEAFALPLRDVAHDRERDEFFCPGSLLSLDLDPRQPLAYGMPLHTAGFFSFSSAYDWPDAASLLRGPSPDAIGIETIARYASKDLLVSGWLEGEQVIAGRAAAVQVTMGRGRIVLLGFPVQHRGQSDATFRLLFNAIFTS
jgi:hypothetical protein